MTTNNLTVALMEASGALRVRRLPLSATRVVWSGGLARRPGWFTSPNDVYRLLGYRNKETFITMRKLS